MTPELLARDEFIVVGVRTVLELDDRSLETLWREKFMPKCAAIPVSDHRYFGVFNMLPDDQWCRVEYVAGVTMDSLENIPAGMVGWVVPSGSYAETVAVGLPGIGQVCRELIAEWLPDSGYKLMASPMFAYTSDPTPHSPEARWKVNIPVDTPEALAMLQSWLC